MWATATFEQYYRDLCGGISDAYDITGIYCNNKEYLSISNNVTMKMREIDKIHIEQGTPNGRPEKVVVDGLFIDTVNEHLNLDNPNDFNLSMMINFGTAFGWRGGDGPKIYTSHFKFSKLGKLDIVEYHPPPDKNHTTGVKIGRTGHKNKIRRAAAVDLPWCIVKLLKTRLSKQPPSATEIKNPQVRLFLQPKKSWNTGTQWFTNAVWGKATFHSKFKDLLVLLIDTEKIDKSLSTMTLHSFRAGTVTLLTNNDISDKRIMDRTGHTTVSGLDPYKMQNGKQILEETFLLLGGEDGSDMFQETQSKANLKKRKFTKSNEIDEKSFSISNYGNGSVNITINNIHK